MILRQNEFCLVLLKRCVISIIFCFVVALAVIAFITFLSLSSAPPLSLSSLFLFLSFILPFKILLAIILALFFYHLFKIEDVVIVIVTVIFTINLIIIMNVYKVTYKKAIIQMNCNTLLEVKKLESRENLKIV